jgi:hypothetical protein
VERPRLFLEWVRLYALPALAVLAFLAVAVWMLDLAPRTHLTFAAGRPGSAYHELAERYRAILARDGIDLEILDSAGSVENLELLTRSERPADAGFLQGGVNPPPDSELERWPQSFSSRSGSFTPAPCTTPRTPPPGRACASPPESLAAGPASSSMPWPPACSSIRTR